MKKPNKLNLIKIVRLATGCDIVTAEIALDNNRWNDDEAIIEILEGVQ